MIAASAAPHVAARGMAIRHAVGTRDDTRELNRSFSERMRELKIPHDYHEIPGIGHDARALLLRLLEIDPHFYTRALMQPVKERSP